MTRELLVIRADADARIGAGHVMRMLALAQAWQDGGGTARFVCRPLPPTLRQRLAAEGMDLVDLPAGLGLREDAEFLARATPAGGWACLDGYHFDTAYQRTVRRSGLRTLVMDDANDRVEYEADVLVNQNARAETIRYRTNPDARLLLGLPYALLRREFRTGVAQRSHPPRARRLLAVFGGFNTGGMARTTLDALILLADPGLELCLAAGPAPEDQRELIAHASSLSGPVDVMPFIEDMPAKLAWADMALSAAGSTCWELCRMGVPALVTALADNQEGIAEALHKAGACSVLPTPLRADALAQATDALAADLQLRRNMSETGRRLVDGQGAQRVARLLREATCAC